MNLLEVSRQSFDNDVDRFPVSVEAGGDGQEREDRRFRERAEYGGHGSCECHEGDESH